MSHDGSTGAGTTPSPVTLLQMMTGYWVSQAIYVAAKLGLADQLAAGPRGVTDLASAAHADAPSLQRVLRALASVGIFTEASPGTFDLTPLADLLRGDVPGSMRALAITYNEEQYRAWGELLYSVRTGGVAFEHLYGMHHLTYRAQHPEVDRIFNEAMIDWTNQVAGAVVGTFDFSPFGTIVDVGGGYGALLAAVLRENPQARGILFDQPHVIAQARGVLEGAGVADRCRRVGGDFFAEIPAGADAYILAQILHGFDDERCLAILAQCRRAIPDHGKLLVVELVVPTGEEPSFGKWLDLHMLVMAGGRQRTADQYDQLFQAAGFRLTQVVPTAAGPSVVVAIPA